MNISETCHVIGLVFRDSDYYSRSGVGAGNGSSEESPEVVRETDSGSGGASSTDHVLKMVKFCATMVLNPAICVAGLVGNLLNIIVLSRVRMQAAMSSPLETSSRTGFIGLAVTDMLCCAGSLVVTFFVREQAVFRPEEVVPLNLIVYGPYFQNSWMKASTWLTVMLTVERYVAICRPIHARHTVDVRATRAAIVAIVLLSGLIELPTVWTHVIVELNCPGSGGRYFLLDQGPFAANVHLKTGFTCVSTVVGFLLPVAILAYCNVHLVRALRESFRVGRLYRVNFRSSSAVASNRLTLTLISIVCMFLVLVTPSEALHLFYFAFSGEHWRFVSVAIVLANLLQTANFAFNFVLYCVVNVQFRETWKDVVLCALHRGRPAASAGTMLLSTSGGNTTTTTTKHGGDRPEAEVNSMTRRHHHSKDVPYYTISLEMT